MHRAIRMRGMAFILYLALYLAQLILVFARRVKYSMSELASYDYDLPKELIAQSPVVCRSDARLLVVDRQRNSLEHKHIRDLPEILRQGDCLVVNNTRVVPARLVGRRHGTGGHWEGLFIEASPDGLWRIMCKTRGRLQARRHRSR